MASHSPDITNLINDPPAPPDSMSNMPSATSQSVVESTSEAIQDVATESGTMPSVQDLSKAQDELQSIAPVDRLSDLVARATASYAIKAYSSASELYSQAVELQAEINGEMAIENADLLYSYGRCLYHVAVRQSDVLGGGAAGAKLNSKDGTSGGTRGKKRKLNGNTAQTGEAATSSATDRQEQEKTEPVLAKIAEQKEEETLEEATARIQQNAEKPLFSFQGDENFEDDSDEDEEEEAADAEEEEQDDFQDAYEVLDLARVLLMKRLEALEQTREVDNGKDKGPSMPELDPQLRDIKERMADIHDLQSEISLEAERFSAAAADLTAMLALKQQLYPLSSSHLAECHYKLSLALEFAAQTQQHDSDGNPIGELVIDQKMRDEATANMELAIESLNLRIANERADLAKKEHEIDAVEKEKLDRNIAEVEEMKAEMDVRLSELRKPPITVKEEEERAAKAQMQGIMKSLVGGTADQQAKVLEEASKGANDLSGMVKRKKPKAANGTGTASPASNATPEPTSILKEDSNTTANGTSKAKRKAVDFADEVEELGGPDKKARVEDAIDE